jgi:hypothetical protein
MPNVPVEFLRGVLGVLCIFFAHMAGRSAMAVRKGQQKVSRLYAWILRTMVCAAIMVFRHPVDNIAITVWTMAAAAFAFGLWSVSRQKPSEDLTHEIFPE